MKKSTTLILSTFLLVATFAFVAAEDVEELETPTVGTFAKLRLAFTFNQEKKISRALEIAEANFAKAEELSETDPEKSELLMNEYEKMIGKAEATLEKMNSNVKNEKDSENQIAKMARIQNRFEQHQEQIDEVYLRAMERFDANNASADKIARFETRYEQVSNKNQARLETAEQRQEQVMERYQQISGMSAEQVNATLARIQEREGILEQKEARLERIENRLEKATEVQAQKMIRYQTGNISREMIQTREMIQERIENSENLRNSTQKELEKRDFGIDAKRKIALNLAANLLPEEELELVKETINDSSEEELDELIESMDGFEEVLENYYE